MRLQPHLARMVEKLPHNTDFVCDTHMVIILYCLIFYNILCDVFLIFSVNLKIYLLMRC